MQDLAGVVAGTVTAYLHKDAPGISPTRWKRSLPHFEQAVDLVRRTSYRGVLPGALALDTYEEASQLFVELYNHFRAKSDQLGAEGIVLPDESGAGSRIYFDDLHVTEDIARSFDRGEEFLSTDARPVKVVIPFRSKESDGSRRANLRECLMRLQAQTLSRERFTISLVEADLRPRNEDIAHEFAVDEYLFTEDDGPFNKSAALNAGAGSTGANEVLCLLDADMALDADFLERVQGLPPATTLIPYTAMLSLAPAASASSTGVAPERTPLRPRGYALPFAPGGCVCIDSASYWAVGGFDEKFVGWGGEDRDFINRASAVARLHRFAGSMPHLWHQRPELSAAAREAYAWDGDARSLVQGSNL